MKPGDTLEVAIWDDGRAGRLIRMQFEQDAKVVIETEAKRHGLAASPVQIEAKKPGDPRVPPVPPHIAGPDVVLLVAHATVIQPAFTPKASSFVQDLDRKDLETLRRITRRVHKEHNPMDHTLSDRECDLFIEAYGPEAAMDIVRREHALH